MYLLLYIVIYIFVYILIVLDIYICNYMYNCIIHDNVAALVPTTRGQLRTCWAVPEGGEHG